GGDDDDVRAVGEIEQRGGVHLPGLAAAVVEQQGRDRLAKARADTPFRADPPTGPPVDPHLRLPHDLEDLGQHRGVEVFGARWDDVHPPTIHIDADVYLRGYEGDLKRIDRVAQEVGASVAGLLRVELGGREWAVLDGGEEGDAVFGPGEAGGGDVVAVGEFPLLGGGGVDEVEAGFGVHAGEQGAVGGWLHGVPAHVRQDRGVQT